MKSLLFLSFLVCSFTADAKTPLISGEVGNGKIHIHSSGKEWIFSAPRLNTRYPDKPCSNQVMARFQDRLQKLYDKSLPIPENIQAYSIALNGKAKRVAHESPLGSFLSQSTNQIIILKREMDIACKRK